MEDMSEHQDGHPTSAVKDDKPKMKVTLPKLGGNRSGTSPAEAPRAAPSMGAMRS